MFLYLVTVFVILLIWAIVDNWKRKKEKRPPGPYKYPIIGNLLWMLPSVVDASKIKPYVTLDPEFVEKYLKHKPAYIVLDELSRMYGSLTSMKFGVNSAVIVASSEHAKEVFCREEFANRFGDGWFWSRQFGKPLGLIFNNGKPYRNLKMFTMKQLKAFGLGRKENMEISHEDELVSFLQNFKQKMETGGNVVVMHHAFTLPILNILWQMVAGIRFSYDDKKMHQLIAIVEELSRSHDIGGNILMAFPWLRFIAPELTGHGHQMRLYDELKDYFWNLLHERMAENSDNFDNPRDFMDVFVHEIRKQELSPQSSREWLTEEQFVIVCMDLFTAGSETTANTLEFAFLYVMANPRVQKKVQAEIDAVIGQSRLPNMEDKLKMPYTSATLLESQRMCNVIPLVHRVATKDTMLGSYKIKKDEVLVVNLHTVHKDPKVWSDPHTFYPERFLDENGNFTNLESFLPFGMGKRVCMGEVLAKHTLFTYFTSMLQRYSFQFPVDQPMPKLRPIGFTMSPDPFSAVVTPRVPCC